MEEEERQEGGAGERKSTPVNASIGGEPGRWEAGWGVGPSAEESIGVGGVGRGRRTEVKRTEVKEDAGSLTKRESTKPRRQIPQRPLTDSLSLFNNCVNTG